MPAVPPDHHVASARELEQVLAQDKKSIFLLFFDQEHAAAFKRREDDPDFPAFSLWTDKTPEVTAWLQGRSADPVPTGCTAASFCPPTDRVVRTMTGDPTRKPNKIKVLELILAAGACKG